MIMQNKIHTNIVYYDNKYNQFIYQNTSWLQLQWKQNLMSILNCCVFLWDQRACDFVFCFYGCCSLKTCFIDLWIHHLFTVTVSMARVSQKWCIYSHICLIIDILIASKWSCKDKHLYSETIVYISVEKILELDKSVDKS